MHTADKLRQRNQMSPHFEYCRRVPEGPVGLMKQHLLAAHGHLPEQRRVLDRGLIVRLSRQQFSYRA